MMPSPRILLNVVLKHPTETHFQDNYGLPACDCMYL